MAKNNNLSDFLKGIADKFRAVLGGTDLINPQDFEDKIQQVNDAAHDAGYAEGYAQGGPTGITADAQDVLEGKIYGSGGNMTSTGLMPDYPSDYNVYGSLDADNQRFRLKIPRTGRYTADRFLYVTYAGAAQIIGLTAGMIAKGKSLLGINGSYSTPSSGQNAVIASAMLETYSGFANGGAEVKGSMKNYDTSGVKTATTDTSDGNPSYRLANSRLEIAPQTGKWAHDWAKGIVIPQANLATLIGLTAAKIVSGNTILGIAGSAQKKWTIVGLAWAASRDTDDKSEEESRTKNITSDVNMACATRVNDKLYTITITFKTAGVYRVILQNVYTGANTFSGKHTANNQEVTCAANNTTTITCNGSWVQDFCLIVIKVG